MWRGSGGEQKNNRNFAHKQISCARNSNFNVAGITLSALVCKYSQTNISGGACSLPQPQRQASDQILLTFKYFLFLIERLLPLLQC